LRHYSASGGIVDREGFARRSWHPLVVDEELAVVREERNAVVDSLNLLSAAIVCIVPPRLNSSRSRLGVTSVRRRAVLARRKI
jgi:hypothetical protein